MNVKYFRMLPSWLIPASGVFVAIFIVFWVRQEPDFGWHLQSGRYILAHGLPSHDIFTYTAAAYPWVNHEWLSDILIVGLFGVGGFAAVAAFFAAGWTAALVVASRQAHWVVLAPAAAAVMDIITARSNMFTALFLVLLMWALERKLYWWLVPLFWLWANLHGGFVLGFIFVLAAGWRDRKYWLVLPACVAVTLINPYGWHLYGEIWQTLSDTQLHYRVVEWRPTPLTVFSGAYIVAFLAAGVAARWRPKFILPGLMFLSAVSAVRQFPLFVVSSLKLVDEAYRRMASKFRLDRGARRYLVAGAATVYLGVSVVLVVLSPYNLAPVAQVADLRAQPCQGNLFNDYDFGGYLIWQLPQTKIYIDGRMPSWRWQGKDYMGTWIRILSDEQVRRREFARYDVGCALVSAKRTRLIAGLKRDGWQVTSADNLAVLLRRPGQPN